MNPVIAQDQVCVLAAAGKSTRAEPSTAPGENGERIHKASLPFNNVCDFMEKNIADIALASGCKKFIVVCSEENYKSLAHYRHTRDKGEDGKLLEHPTGLDIRYIRAVSQDNIKLKGAPVDGIINVMNHPDVRDMFQNDPMMWLIFPDSAMTHPLSEMQMTPERILQDMQQKERWKSQQL